MRSHFQLLLCVAGLCGVAQAQSTPTITSLNPSSIAAGSLQFTLVVTGTNFAINCYATWNGLVLSSALKSSTEIDAIVLASYLTNPGETAYVGVSCPPVQSNLVAFQVTGTSSALTITTPPTLTQATAGNFYMVTFQASGGTPSYTWSLALGSALPAGLTLSPSGVLQGKPQVGQYTFNIQVVDSSSPQVSVQQTFMLTVAAAGSFTITTPSPLPAATIGTLYSVNLAVSGGTQPYMWSLTSGSVLPNNLTLSTSGALTGTPTTAGQYTFTIQVTDSSSPALMAQQTFSLTVGSSSGGGLAITTSSLPAATTGQTYTTTLAASGGTPPYTWSAAPGTTLPTWLTLVGATGVLSGVPPAAGTYTVSVQVADSASHTTTKSFSLVVSSGSSSITITTGATLVQGTVGAPYYQILAATGGTQPYIWSALTALPPGLNLDPSGFLSGTPTAASPYTFTIQVSDSSSTALTAQQNFSLTISSPGGTLTISTSSLPAASAGEAYTATVTAYNGFPPYTWAAPSSTPLPSWLTLDPNAGVLSGTPPTVATYTVAVQVTDSASPAHTSSKSFTLSVTMPSLTITTPSPLPAGMVGVAYSPIVFSASGGMGPYTFVVFSGNSDGLAFGSDNVTFSGTPQAAGTFTFMVQAADSTGLQATANFTLTVSGPAAPPLTITTSSLPGAPAGQAYTSTLAASGGTPPYTWSVASGTSLPSWLTLTGSTGVLSGTPPASGTFTISIQVTDSTTPTAKTASRTFTLVVTAPAVSITTAPTLPAGMAGAAYPSTTLAATGGTLPYTWVILSGNTDGLSLDPTGVISGTPQTAGTFTFTVQVTDNSATALQGSKTFSLTVSGPTLTITTTSSSSGTVGVAFSQSYTVVGGTAPYTWTVTNGSLPWLTLSPTTATPGPVTLSGTPTQQGSFTITLQAKDANGAVGTKTVTITIAAGPLKITSANQLPAGTLGSTYSFSMTAVGGTPPYTWSATGLPSGVSISSAGLISGTISAAGTLSFVVKVTDSATPPATVQDNFHISVTPPTLPAITISGLPVTANPLAQYTVTVSLASAYSVNITGTAILSSSPSDSGPSDGSIQFSGGGKSASFTLNAGQTSTTLAIQTGSVAGTVTLTLSQLSAGGTDVTPTPAPSAKAQMAAAAPVITAATASRNTSTNTLTIQITGYATSRDMQQAVFTFSAASGQTLQTGASSITVSLSSLFSAYFQNSQYATFGSQFVFSQPFTIQGDINSVIPQSVTLTNRIGSSTPSAVQ
jgi:Putative Ig domain